MDSVVSNIVFMLVGAALSLYATIVFERFKRFKENVRSIGEARQLYEGYPVSLAQIELERAHGRAIDFWRLLESKQWALNADQHYRAAAKVDKLKNFAFRTTTLIEKLQRDDTKGLEKSQFLSAFQAEYNRIKSDEFVQFEKEIRPGWWALLKPFPNPVLPKQATTVMVNYFDKLL